MQNKNDRILFWGCFIALVTTAFAFVLRSLTVDQWAPQFNLSYSQSGEILGAGIWPMAITIILFSLIIDKVGYGKSMVFAFLCHASATVIVMCAPMVLAKEGADALEIAAGHARGYKLLYFGYFIMALGNGTVEAVINPVVATMFSREKPKWLNILHAGWPGGLVVGGVLALASARFYPDMPWNYKISLVLLPTILYGILMLGRAFPVNERVAAGVTYRDMLREFGFFGALIVTTLLVFEVTRLLEGAGMFFNAFDENFRLSAKFVISVGIAGAFGLYCGSFGRPMLIFLLLLMIPLATTELGTDSWIGDIMTAPLKQLGLQGGWVLVYTSLIMMILRFFAGPIVHKLSPLGLLATSSVVAAIGLVALSKTTGMSILVAATLYGFGKTFFWPTMLGVVSEQFPKGGALTLNATGGVGMLGVGVVGTVLLGMFQNQNIQQELQAQRPELITQITAEQTSVFGRYMAIQEDKVIALPKADQTAVAEIQNTARKASLMKVAILPVIMFVCYMLLIFYFKSKGGYQAEVLTGHAADDAKFTGGTVGPGEG